jgi:hypothetical protein
VLYSDCNTEGQECRIIIAGQNKEGKMRLKVLRKQYIKSGMVGGNKYRYSLKIMAEMTKEETQVLNKYEYLTQKLIIDPEISANIEV